MSESNQSYPSLQAGARGNANSALAQHRRNFPTSAVAAIDLGRHRFMPKLGQQAVANDSAIENAVKGAIATLHRDFPNVPREIADALQILAHPRQSMVQNQMIEARAQMALASLRGEYPDKPMQALNEYIFEAVHRARAQLISLRTSK